jgi:uncharacterized protein YeeX (DUF496 family)
MNIKYKFMDLGMTQIELADIVSKRMKEDGVNMVCDRCCVSLTLSKQKRGLPLTEKEQKVYGYLLNILEEL